MLIVPVLRNVDQMSLREIRVRSADLYDRARAQRLKREELSGARTAEELSSLVRRSAREGTLEGDTARLLARTGSHWYTRVYTGVNKPDREVPADRDYTEPPPRSS